jgi:ABC-2 type transport system permease protein
MRNTWIILKRELGAYFSSPIAYIVGAVFLLVSGIFFLLYLNQREASLRNWMGFASVMVLFIAPMLTMRLLAEEKQSGTIELLLTSPLQDWELIVGKFMGALSYWAVLLITTLVYPIILTLFGNPDPVPILTGYLALLLLGAAILSIGVLTSALSPNQIVAVFVGFVLALILWVANGIPLLVKNTVGDIIGYLSLTTHMEDLMKGVVDSRDIVFYLSVTVGCLFIAIRVIEARRWS